MINDKRRSTRNKTTVSPNSEEDSQYQLYTSQNIVIQSICEQSLLNPLVKSELPPQLDNIYRSMMLDIAFINSRQTSKDYDFYKCNMTFFNGEDIISKKMKDIMKDRAIKRKNKIITKLSMEIKNKTSFKHRKKVGKEFTKLNKYERNDNDDGRSSADSVELKRSAVDRELEVEWTPEKQSFLKSYKKKQHILDIKKRIKSYRNVVSLAKELSETETPFNDNQTVLEKFLEKSIFCSEEMRSIEENKTDSTKSMSYEDVEDFECIAVKERCISAKRSNKRKTPLKFDIEPSSVKIKVAKICQKVEKTLLINLDHSYNEVIDLSSEDSAEENAAVKSKVYFREPILRKQAAINCKKLKEHTLLDKIMLGINCVRHWSDKGLHLTRVTENDLGLLNKRLSNVKCTMSDLEEHTDENNNKSLSLLIQSEMFVNLPSVTVKPVPTNKPYHEDIKSKSPENKVIRARSRHHISSMYRHKYNLPSILSKPTLTQESSFKKYVSKPNSLLRFSEGAQVDLTSKSSFLELNENQIPSDPSMSVSQMLRIKNKNSPNNSVKIKTFIANDEHSQSLPNTQLIKISPSNGILNLRPQSIIYQSMPRNKLVLPFQLTHSKLVPFPQTSFRFPLSKTVAHESIRFTNLSRFQQVSVNKSFFSNPNRLPRPDNISSISQPSILKNLLQQSNQQLFPNKQINLSSSHMVPLSVFQSNKTKWQVGSVSQYRLKK